jgi:hypothetical protein
MRIHILDRGEEKKENSLNSRFSLSLSLCTRIWDGLGVRAKEEKCQSYDSEFTGRERRKSNGYMDECVSSASYATLGGMSDHHYVFLCYLTD